MKWVIGFLCFFAFMTAYFSFAKTYRPTAATIANNPSTIDGEAAALVASCGNPVRVLPLRSVADAGPGATHMRVRYPRIEFLFFKDSATTPQWVLAGSFRISDGTRMLGSDARKTMPCIANLKFQLQS